MFVLWVIFLHLFGTAFGFYNSDAHQMKLIEDFIQGQEVSNNIIFITSPNVPDVTTKLTQLTSKSCIEMFTITVITFRAMNRKKAKEIHKIHKKDNQPPMYIMLPSNIKEEKLVHRLIEYIRRADDTVRVAVIYNRKVDIKSIYQRRKSYDVYLFNPNSAPDGKISSYSQYDVCMYCHAGRDKIKLTNTWTVKLGFQNHVKLVKSFTGNMFGRSLRVGCNYKSLTGPESRNYAILGGMMNSKWRIVNTRPRWPGWTNLVMLYYMRRVHMIGCGIVGGLVHWRNGRLGFSASSQYVEGERIISIEPDKGLRWFAIVQPFSPIIWSLVLFSVLLIGMFLWMLRKAEGNHISKSNSLWTVAQVICWDSISVKLPSLSICFLLSSYMVYSMMVIIFYTDMYTCQVVKQDYLNPPVDSIGQFYNKTEMTLYVYGKHPSPGSKIRQRTQYLLNAFGFGVIDSKIGWVWTQSLLKKFGLGDKNYGRVGVNKKKSKSGPRFIVKFPTNLVSALKRLQKRPEKLVTLSDPYSLAVAVQSHFLDPKYKKFHISKQRLPDQYQFLYFPKQYSGPRVPQSYFPYKETLNEKILLLHAMGFPQHHVANHNITLKIAMEKYKHGDNNTDLITFIHMVGGIILMGVGYFVAFIGLFLELSVNKIHDAIRKEMFVPQRLPRFMINQFKRNLQLSELVFSGNKEQVE